MMVPSARWLAIDIALAIAVLATLAIVFFPPHVYPY
jgi:hypothetical protein